MGTEEKFCIVCGKKIENPKSNSKTCLDAECMRINRCRVTRANQIERCKNPEYKAEVNARSKASYHRKTGRIAELEHEVLACKAAILTDKLKATYFAGGCGGENIDKLLAVVKSVISDVDTIDDAIASLDAETV